MSALVLHISDLHLSSRASSGYDRDKVLRPFLNTCRSRSEIRPPDLIAFTGDIAGSGLPEEYALAAEFIEQLVHATGVGRDRLWIVPGNHDVRRAAGSMLRRTLESAQEAEQNFFSSADARQTFLSKFDAFRTFLMEVCPSVNIAENDVVRGPAILELDGWNLGVAAFNSAWFAQGDDDAGKLWIGTRLVRERAEVLDSLGADFRVALMHHPVSWMHENEPAGAWLQDQYDLLLRGHLHKPYSARTDTTASSMSEIATGALYQGSYQPCRINLVEIKPDRGQIRVEPLVYVDDPAAKTWVIDSSVFPASAADGFVGTISVGTVTIGSESHDRSATLPATPIGSPRWLPDLADWFSHAYAEDRERAMNQVEEICVELQAAALDQTNFRNPLAKIGVALKSCLPVDDGPIVAHDRLVLEVLALDVVGPVSHLFMVPTVDMSALFSNSSYAELIMSTRLLGRGDFSGAEVHARNVGVGCCVAGFVIGQALRKQERTLESKAIFEFIEDESLGAPGVRACNASPSQRCLCRPELLEAELQRALGVVNRRLGRSSEAARHLTAAREVAEAQLRLASDQEVPLTETFEAALRVAADVFYSEGYMHFEVAEYELARPLFERSIDAASRSRMVWDAPSTRLGLCRLIEGDTLRGLELLLLARELCQRSLGQNREAALSLSLCSLGVHVAAEIEGLPPVGDPLVELEQAVHGPPVPGLGALKCHLSDASKLTSLTGTRSGQLVRDYAEELGAAVRGH